MWRIGEKNTARVMVRNKGQGRFTATAQVQATGVTANNGLGGNNGAGGGAPGGGIIITFPGGGLPGVLPGVGNNPGTINVPTAPQQTAIAGSAPQLSIQPQPDGTTAFNFTINPSVASSLGSPLPSDFTVQSNEAINLPPLVRVVQNSRNAEATGEIIPVNVGASAAEGLVDIITDSVRQRVYIANSGMNQVEVFDTKSKAFLSPIKVGQLPRSLAITPDGNTLYVANTGGESISIIDLDKGQVTGKVKFPALPYNASTTLITPSLIASTLRGLQIVMSNGALWKTVNDEAFRAQPMAQWVPPQLWWPRPERSRLRPAESSRSCSGGDGRAYLYDSNVDEYVIGQTVINAPIQGYFGPLGRGSQRAILCGERHDPESIVDACRNRNRCGVTTTGRPISAVTPVSCEQLHSVRATDKDEHDGSRDHYSDFGDGRHQHRSSSGVRAGAGRAALHPNGNAACERWRADHGCGCRWNDCLRVDHQRPLRSALRYYQR